MKITPLYMASSAGDIMRISANGGTPESIVKLKSGSLTDPQILPDGKSILYTSYRQTTQQPKIMVQSLKSGETKELFAGFDARYLPTGHIIYRLPNNSNLFAIPFDPDRLEVKGGAGSHSRGRDEPYAISNSGTLAYIPEPSGGAAVRTNPGLGESRGKRRTTFSRSESIIWFLEYLPMGSEWLCLSDQLRSQTSGSGI